MDISQQKAPEDCAKFYLDGGAGCCVFTMGKEGAFYADRAGKRVNLQLSTSK
jgi:hypothetical protein